MGRTGLELLWRMLFNVLKFWWAGQFLEISLK
jgi:hypothetical protein